MRPQEDFDLRDILVFKCIIEAYFCNAVSGSEMSRAYFRTFQTLDTVSSGWPAYLRDNLEYLFYELDQTVWREEEGDWTQDEIAAGDYNTSVTIEQKMKRTLVQINTLLQQGFSAHE